MLHNTIPLSETRSFTPFFLDYISQKQSLTPFYDSFPVVENFNKLLTKKAAAFPPGNRTVLKQTLERQYGTMEVCEKVRSNIAALQHENTFTITTGHQLNIFTGPLYFIYKIVTVINACKVLKQKFPDYTFVPVYWMASEDHDYDEIKYFRLYGKKYVWETKQKGAVGRFATEGFEEILNALPGDADIFRQAYLKHKHLSEAARYYVNALFGDGGLVTLDADDKQLKSLAKNVVREDVLKNTTAGIVAETNKKLEGLGYEAQVYCRDINFFYLDDQIRSRIEKKQGRYHVLETGLTFSEDEILSLIDSNPERFSPNVILRPLYQEMILPNVAYVGGPAEVVYWLQLKEVFNHYSVPFPALMPRNFALVVDRPLLKKLEKTGLGINIFFEPLNFINNHWVLKNTHHNLTVGPERSTINSIFEALKERAGSIDKTLVQFVGAEGKRTLNSLEKIEKKMLRAEKRLHADRLRQISEVKEALFPNGGLQERTDNFLNFYQQDQQFISKLIRILDPFDFNFNILTYTG
jgi:bacillithiol synthase